MPPKEKSNFVRIAATIFTLTAILSAIGIVFWYQEIQYLLPTPKPKNYKAVLPNEIIKLDSALVADESSKPKLFHFVSPDCPCSRFNLNHFLSLIRKYNKEIHFYAVVTDEEKASEIRDIIEDDITVLVDKDEKIAKACGVYSTPQAAILQQNNKLYFRGNYNRARYCTAKASNYVQMALDSLVAKKGPPRFVDLATESYGCVLSQNEEPFILP